MGLSFGSCSGNNGLSNEMPNDRFLYTSSNGVGNSVFRLNIQSDGTLLEIDTDSGTEGVQGYLTGGTGDANDGKFDGQNSIIMLGNYLLVVNAGGIS